MPRGKSTLRQSVPASPTLGSVRRAGAKDEWGGFVQVTVDEAHREGYDLWVSEAGDEVYRELDDALGSGLKLTISYDGANQCYIASLTGKPDIAGERPFTCCLSARAGTFADSLAVLMYKHCALLHYDWWDAVNEPKKSRNAFG